MGGELFHLTILLELCKLLPCYAVKVPYGLAHGNTLPHAADSSMIYADIIGMCNDRRSLTHTGNENYL